MGKTYGAGRSSEDISAGCRNIGMVILLCGQGGWKLGLV